MIALFGVFAVAVGLTPAAIGGHALAGFSGLAIGFALFAFGAIGGGDAKLFAATALWLGFGDLLDYVVVTSLIGGGLALALIAMRKIPMPASLAGRPWLVRLHDAKAGIPYGVALAAAARRRSSAHGCVPPRGLNKKAARVAIAQRLLKHFLKGCMVELVQRSQLS